MKFRPRLLALAVLLPLALAACAPGTPDEPSPSASRIVTDPNASDDAVTPAPTPTVIGGPEVVAVVDRREVVTGLDAPWDMEVTADGSILVSERDTGIIRRVRAGVATALNGPGAEALRAAVDNAGEGGLLGIAVLRAESDTFLYAYLTRKDDNAVLRMPLHDDLLGRPTPIFEGIPAAANHDGGRIAFGPDGYLYVATGDAAQPELAQSTKSPAGKILRLVADGTFRDGRAAPDNPFGNRIWSLGHRNVEGIGWVADGRMYASEFGQDTWDELNLIEAGANYGWPGSEGLAGAPSGTGLGEVADGLTYPVAQWDPDDASPSGIAITHEGIYMASLRGERLWRVPLTADGTGTPHVVLELVGRIRDVAVAPEGGLYVLTNNTDGRGRPAAGDDRIIHITVQ